jgi:signal peptidase I
MNEEIFQPDVFSEENMAQTQEIVLEETASVESAADVTATEQQVVPMPKKTTWQKQLFKDARDVFYMLAIFMFVYILCFRSVVVVGHSMHDTLVNGDRILLINNLLYQDPQRGDIIVASKDSFRNGECIIKRVIATEGQEVDIDFEKGIVYVDGEAIPEPYLYTKTHEQEGVRFPLVVPEGCLFVMGDNRKESMDSRSPAIGFIDKREILGKAVFIMIPGVNADTESRDFGRIGVVG